MTETLTYEASVYKRNIKYRNFKGEVIETALYFALDPIALMQFIAQFQPKKAKKSGDPRKQNEVLPISDEDQVKFVRALCERSAGFPSEDGEVWEPFENFSDTIAGKAFLTKLVSSEADRKEFSEKVILDPFRAFVAYAASDESNSQSEVQQFKLMQEQLENVFKTPDRPDESYEDRRARLQAELAELEGPDEDKA